MVVSFTENGWEDYLHWQQMDKKMTKKINSLLRDIMRSPFSGIGKPEGLKHDLTGLWSRRIDLEHRLVYKVESEIITVISCRFYYDN